MEPGYQWIIRGGRVIDPANNVDAILDVGIRDCRIAEVAREIKSQGLEQIYDAAGKIVTPGLVDLHVHGYHRATPLGIPVDHYCLGRAVTTAVDAGSAGCGTFPGFRAFAAERSKTRLLAFLNISCSGLAFGGLAGDVSVPGELDSLKLVDAPGCIECIQSNRDMIVGVKIRLSASCADEGRNEVEAYRRAREAAASVKLPLMVHHTFSSVPLEDCPGQMADCDIYTHTYHGFPSTIIDRSTRKVQPAVHAARKKGILFDVGHGQGSFSWTVAELCVQEDFWPDTISTDLHSGTCEGPAYDLATVMSRFLHLGLPLPEVIKCCTYGPACAIGWEDRIGTLGIGREADISVLSLQEVDLDLEDCQSQMRRIHHRLVPEAVWRAGEGAEITRPRRWPNAETVAAQKPWWKHLEIRDANP
jgi:dihydroorotase